MLERLAQVDDVAVVPPADPADPLDADLVAQRLDLAGAGRRLSETDQAVMSLTVFDDLSSLQASGVLGISAASYRLRLLRARRALGKAAGQSGWAVEGSNPNPRIKRFHVRSCPARSLQCAHQRVHLTPVSGQCGCIRVVAWRLLANGEHNRRPGRSRKARWVVRRG